MIQSGLRFLAPAIGVLTIALATLGLVARYVSPTNHFLLIAAAMTPYLLLAAPVGLMIALLSRRWWLATCTFALTVSLIATQATLYIPASVNKVGSTELRVMTANIFLGQSDPRALVELATARTDVLTIQELTPESVDGLTAAGLDDTFPYRAIDPRPVAAGSGIWSRYPIVAVRQMPGFLHAAVSARIQVPGLTVDPTIITLHLPGPFPQPINDWSAELDRLPAELDAITTSSDGGCVVLAGDFNTTPDMAGFRRLLEAGFVNAAEQAGAGFVATYPANRPPVPPVIAIDHVLTHRCSARTAEVVTLPGSDHRGLVADLQLTAAT